MAVKMMVEQDDFESTMDISFLRHVMMHLFSPRAHRDPETANFGELVIHHNVLQEVLHLVAAYAELPYEPHGNAISGRPPIVPPELTRVYNSIFTCYMHGQSQMDPLWYMANPCRGTLDLQRVWYGLPLCLSMDMLRVLTHVCYLYPFLSPEGPFRPFRSGCDLWNACTSQFYDP